MTDEVVVLGAVALFLGLLVRWWAARWSVRLMPDAVAVYHTESQCPQMHWPQAWFGLWFAGNVAALIVLRSEAWFMPEVLLVWILWLALLGLLALIDARTGLLPNELTLVLMLSGLVWHSWVTGDWLPEAQYAWGMVLGWAGPFMLDRVHERWRASSAIGQGDAKLLAGIGAWLGWQALPLVWICACAAVLVYTLLMSVAGHGRPSYVTFGPFLAMGASSVMLLNHV